jgi:hypothetical protein
MAVQPSGEGVGVVGHAPTLKALPTRARTRHCAPFAHPAVCQTRKRSIRGIERMAQYKLHCVGASGNAYKVALYLNCADLDWEPVGVDFAGGETRDANWRAKTNAMGEVPVLELAGKQMSQSGAILMWLADTTGKFAPDTDERLEAMRWLFSIITSLRRTTRCIDFKIR